VSVPFHDNLEPTPLDGLSCLVEVERIYDLDWARFDDSHRRELARIDEGLPGAAPERDALSWFGDDEDVPPFLKASVVPNGLRVRGILPEADWCLWDERFRESAAGLPCSGPAGNV
jgi:hypothetical protein